MKALSLTQPWATLIAIGAKSIETRSWSTPYRGRVAIHAAKKFPPDCRELCWLGYFRRSLEHFVDFNAEDDDIDALERYALPLGAIVATATLESVQRVETLRELSDQEEAFGDYSAGRFGWSFRDVKALPEPIFCKGALGLWQVPTAMLKWLS